MSERMSLDYMSEQGKPCKVVNDRGWPLYFACTSGDFKIATFLMENGSKLEEPGELFTQPIHIACEHFGVWMDEETRPLEESMEACSFVERAIENGAKVNLVRKVSFGKYYHQPNYLYATQRNDLLETPLHIAVRKRFSFMVWLLVSYGANFVFDVPCVKQVLEKEEQLTAWQICTNEETRRALKNEWTPNDHKNFPCVVKRAIKCTLLVQRRQGWNLPVIILHRIFQFIAYGWLLHDN
eukprot:Phypoly_transcript_15401.p1 GENE.Phypoly_transcript_15401~~Phypoly_transcript_15401.p1  ORF type:complete len:272 (+),score=24.26 Phypoly_transcript_15401:100-816(+)